MSEKKKAWIWILIPLLYGALSFVLLWIFPLRIGQIVFGAFWLWVGMRFARLEGSSVKNFVWGNSLWLISFLLYLWQFVLLDDANRNMALAAWSQYYAVSFVMSGAWVYLAFEEGVIRRLLSRFMLMASCFWYSRSGFYGGRSKRDREWTMSRR
ncbi:hypothetical protein [Saccharibacillus qingshengii]|uniref:hypothetical protein n=1 Tax=Saccharibacillus qingshengii TaxID=1763540 RepID=UPI001551C76D|nr:hypothetical protein [Saccharibacillus qingshengii]